MSLGKYIVKRILVMIPVLFGALTIGFFLSRFMPGDPIKLLMGAKGFHWDPVVYEQLIREYGFDQPLIIQYFRYIGELFTGNWGVSISINKGQEVWSLIMQRLPRTIDITITTVIISSIFGVVFGVFSAKNRNKSKDTAVRFIALLGVSIPIFFLGMIVQYYICYLLPSITGTEGLAATGFKNMAYPDPPFVTGFRAIDAFISGQWYLIVDYALHLLLPILCLSFHTLAGITRQSRSSMLEILEQDYIRTARAKGCTETDVIYSHALKNSLIPTVTVIGLNFAGLLSGAILTETTFNLIGIGDLLISSLKMHDYWVLNAVIFITTLMFVIVVLITDILYAILDPRIVY